MLKKSKITCFLLATFFIICSLFTMSVSAFEVVSDASNPQKCPVCNANVYIDNSGNTIHKNSHDTIKFDSLNAYTYECVVSTYGSNFLSTGDDISIPDFAKFNPGKRMPDGWNYYTKDNVLIGSRLFPATVQTGDRIIYSTGVTNEIVLMYNYWYDGPKKEWVQKTDMNNWGVKKDSDFTLENILTFSTKPSSPFYPLWVLAEELYNVFKYFGALLMVVYFLIALFEKTGHEQLNMEHFFFEFLKLIVGILVLNAGFDIIVLIFDFASGALGIVSGEFSTSSVVSATCIANQIKEYNVIECIGAISETLLPKILMWTVRLLLNLICWSRLLDIVTRIMFAPIGMADIIKGGRESKGWHYLLRMLSSGLQGAVLITILSCYSLVQMFAITDSGASGIAGIVLAIVTIMTLMKAQTIADDVVGV